MTFGQLFRIMHPEVKIRENGTCIWLYFDEANYYTIATEWWYQEIPDNVISMLEEQRTVKMTDEEKALYRDKVMQELNEQIHLAEYVDDDYRDCVPVWALKGAYKLLKEQESVRPIAKKEMDEITSYLETVYYCGNCHACLPLYKEYNVFCPKCGRRINWND